MMAANDRGIGHSRLLLSLSNRMGTKGQSGIYTIRAFFTLNLILVESRVAFRFVRYLSGA